jgi:Flp pilus assembly protein TadG
LLLALGSFGEWSENAMIKLTLLRLVREHKGATVVFVAIAMVMFLGFAALAVDLGYLYVVRGELQNAADSGALAGAQVLYDNNGTAVNADANQKALEFVQNNYSEQAQATVADFDRDIQRGHWSFATRTFTANDSLLPTVLWNATTAELDANTNFINAVSVTTSRKRVAGGLPGHFFANIFGAAPSEVKATAVAYIGFAGQLEPGAVDFPIAICRKAILNDDQTSYTCGVGRMINSGHGNPTNETGGWTNYSQPCITAGPNTVRPILERGSCGSAGNEEVILLGGEGMGTTGGMVDTVLDRVVNCWTGWTENRPYDPTVLPPPTRPWKMKLPVVDCDKNNIGNCVPVAGAVVVNVVWIAYKNDPNYLEVPRTMYYPNSEQRWNCSTTAPGEAAGRQCWSEFTSAFELHYRPGQYATYQEKTLYFLPDCTPHELTGLTGGENFGVLAKIPVLVK